MVTLTKLRSRLHVNPILIYLKMAYFLVYAGKRLKRNVHLITFNCYSFAYGSANGRPALREHRLNENRGVRATGNYICFRASMFDHRTNYNWWTVVNQMRGVVHSQIRISNPQKKSLDFLDFF